MVQTTINTLHTPQSRVHKYICTDFLCYLNEPFFVIQVIKKKEQIIINILFIRKLNFSDF